MGLGGPCRFVGWTCSQRKFPAVFAKSENGFVRAEFCFVVHWVMKHCRPAEETLEARNWFIGRSEIKRRTREEPGPACRTARSGVGGTYAPYRALSRLIRSRHQRPSGRGPERRRPVRPPDRRHWRPSRQKAAVFDRGTAGNGPGGIRPDRGQGGLRLR